MVKHEETVPHMSQCDDCRRAAWERRGGHPVLTGRTSSRPPEAIAWGPSTTNPKIERFLETGDPDGV